MHLATVLLTIAPLLQAAAPAQTDPSRGSTGPGNNADQVVWAKTYEEAVAKARTLPSGRVYIEFTEPGCGLCKRMDDLVHPSASFVTFLRDKVPVRLDRKTPEGEKLAAKFGIGELPASLVITPDDELMCGVQVGSTTQTGWFQTWLRAEKSWFQYRKKLENEAKDPGDVALVYDVAVETFKRGGDAMAEPRFTRLTRDPRATAEVHDQSMAYLATIYLDSGRLEPAAAVLEKLRKSGHDSALREKAELRLADVEIARGQMQKAADRLREFMKSHPSSPLVADADKLLQALKPHLAGAESKER
jgi:hypothetical protein